MKRLLALPGAALATLSLALTCFIFPASAQQVEGIQTFNEFRLPKKKKVIRIPQVNGLQVLKCDFHMHTVFTDGDVWPTVRVQEAWQEGLDAISITEHVEYTPFKNDIKPNPLRPYELAKNKGNQNRSNTNIPVIGRDEWIWNID